MTLLPTLQIAAEAKLLAAAAQHLHHLQEGEQQAPQRKLCPKSAINTNINPNPVLPLATGKLEVAGESRTSVIEQFSDPLLPPPFSEPM